MRLGSIFHLRIRSLFSRRTVEQELDEELQFHVEREMEENLAAGMTAEDARYAALRSIKDIEQRKEECRDVRGVNLFESAVQDLRYTLRQLRKNPGFAGTAIFVFALGMAAAAAMFGFVNAALIRPLPYRDQARLVGVFESSPGWPRSMVSYANFADWQRLNTVFSSIAAYAMNGSFTLSSATGAGQVAGTRVSAGFFHTLGVSPVLGRDFRAAEDSPGAARTVILSYAAWQKRFGGRRDVLGQTVTLNGAQNTVIGVLPRDFHFALYGGAEFWGTLRSTDGCEQQRACRNLNTIARLRDGVSIESAAAEMRSIARQLQREYPDSNRDSGSANLVPLRDLIIGDVRPILLVSLSGACLLLLIACINVTTLLLARSERRQREIAVRGALGASSSRLFRQFAIEGLALAGTGGLSGLLFAAWSMRLLAKSVPAEKLDSMPYLRGLGLNPEIVVFACLLSLLGGMLFASIPIARTSLSAMIEGLKEGARGNAGSSWRRFGSNLVVAEVAIAMVLMVSAGLLGKSLYRLLHVEIGFRPDHLALLQTSWAPEKYQTRQQQIVLEHEILERLSSLPGLQSVGLSTAPPIDSAWGTASFHVSGRPNHGESNEVLNRQVSAGYFATLGARLMRGRYFGKQDNASKPPVAIVNQALANKYFPGEDAIGKQIYYDWDRRSLMQIVGIVDDIREGPLEGATWPALYVSDEQIPVAWPAVVMRTSQNPAALYPAAIAAIHSIDPFISVSDGMTMTERINGSPAAYLHRSSAGLVAVFAITAFLLSVVGLYGVVAYSVSQRTREIGVRMALGAEQRSVYQLILREAGRLTAYGVVAGLACSLATATLLRTLLFGVRSWDLPTLSAVAAVLGISALLAGFVPARRAASVNPVEALRAE